MPSITTTDGYTFTNWGPLTMTFTGPASCATATGNHMLGLNNTAPVWEYAVQCSTVGCGDCIPTRTVSLSTTSDENPTTLETQVYFSPGLYCPSRWATRGIAVRDSNNGLSSSGILSPTSISTETIIVEGTTSKPLENIVTAMQPISVMTRTFSPSETS
ncbi:uncharacterized protein P174DRAFT_430474 [Aspergillus novofumigatus IBT 16806]|uniref:Uncharacterized protein n=1 Tax=Aspergillus novofumigatus (strain IBT 16806) TaxID=1392255 RepID=A0A2I1CF03_ASPN1|nr:uncharacterized protein P174DRAFT_430474 [Aspergillus novofumigatus IBT 16806]PKX96202.1 hypothetical protein P174DRAFT_430474 [Aspergillus novofumigatus IBT 16806]